MSWSIILPETGTNKVLNPVAMGTGNYAAVGAGTTVTPTATAGYSYLGYKHYVVAADADNEGMTLTLSALANAIHYVTMRTYGTISNWDWSLDNATYNAPTLLSTEGNFSVYGFSFPAIQANGSTTLYIYKNAAGATTWYISHIQVEQNTYTTTPIIGDIKGFTKNGYYWNGTAHASSSTRAAQERSGGKVVDLDTTYNFKVKYGEGSGMPPIQHHIQSMALLPGSLYQGHKILPRVLDLVSATKAQTPATVAAARKNFINAVKPDRVTPDQPVVFRYSDVNNNKPVDFYAYYDSGMEFQLSSGVVDQPVARFIAYNPFMFETHTESAPLTTNLTVSMADCCIRKIDGTWANISTDFAAAVYAMAEGQDGCIYIGGAFTNVGDVNGDYIVKWNPYTNALSSLGTGMNQAVLALAVAPNGDIYAGGGFTSAGGVAETDIIAYWDISAGAWVSVTATHPSSAINALVFDHSGNLYVGGEFLNLQDANGDYISKFTFGTGWSSLGTGMNGHVHALAIAPNGDLYAGGEFALAGGVADTAYIAYWDIDEAVPAWHPLGTGISGGTPAVYALAFDKAGNLYIGGNFTAANGVACLNIAKWNGKTFEPLGSGVNDTVYSLAFNQDGILYVSGLFTSAGGVSLSDRFAIWNETIWVHPDANLPGAPIVYSILPIDKNLYLGYNTAGDATTSYLNAITNNGSSSAYPVINIHRAEDGANATVEWIKNETSGDTLWCNYILQKGETLTIDLTPGDRHITSSYYGDVWRAVLRSSDLSSFNLLPGANNISVFVNPGTVDPPTITAWMEWPITHWGADNVAA